MKVLKSDTTQATKRNRNEEGEQDQNKKVCTEKEDKGISLARQRGKDIPSEQDLAVKFAQECLIRKIELVVFDADCTLFGTHSKGFTDSDEDAAKYQKSITAFSVLLMKELSKTKTKSAIATHQDPLYEVDDPKIRSGVSLIPPALQEHLGEEAASKIPLVCFNPELYTEEELRTEGDVNEAKAVFRDNLLSMIKNGFPEAITKLFPGGLPSQNNKNQHLEVLELAFKLTSEQILLLDDAVVNVEAARQRGTLGIIVEGKEGLKPEHVLPFLGYVE